MHTPAKRFVYLLRSLANPNRTYTGLTADVAARLAAHNAGKVPSTIRHRPWELLATIEFPQESTAVRFERYLKSGSGQSFARRHFLAVHDLRSR
jgi:putative endonuclease